MAILASLWMQKKDQNLLSQVSTGEEKSLIIAAVAIYKVKYLQRKVDIITSNSVLAERDSAANSKLVEIYNKFEVSVANNCSQSEEERRKAYDSDIVYGTLSDFQRDHLLDTFYDKKIKGTRTCDSVIVDEVDW